MQQRIQCQPDDDATRSGSVVLDAKDAKKDKIHKGNSDLHEPSLFFATFASKTISIVFANGF